ncbi:hypothetical protein P152DRAFT_467220 [Eremomyces bilateralis CBS 781.70]|uniref:Uncharacterized protein n=1 Tax=Eremomyces bilateralis CBS 781.70 TaxID=1392243 RepID=A0A6G1FZ77_9PEZI|nr:uncharacterized protein P152DRAFT_467220 [Eremomyces bilateralis CBS 781.70]KAF1811175.1 hypothetical protein P152DRAFT_467220 [Eremomyces bilateralis CBS 781.70]
MSLARAFTTHRKKPSGSEPPPSPSRAFNMRSKGFDRNKISAPVALLSTTNTLAYNAPDIQTLKTQTRNISNSSSASTASVQSSDESDSRSTSTRSVRSRETLTDASSVGSSPSSPQPNHLSEYFKSASNSGQAGPRRSASSSNLRPPSSRQTQASLHADTPSVPERAASHSKRAHERLARQRSLQHVRAHGSIGSINSIASAGSATPAVPQPMAPREQRSSLDMFNRAAVDASHPFGKELEKLSEVAEEFGDAMRSAEWDEDLAVMRRRGLKRFCAEEYRFEIRPLFVAAFPTTPRQVAAGGAWI